MNDDHAAPGIHFGHEFHGREHHFLVTYEALEFLAGASDLDEAGRIGAYNAHLQRIHAIAEVLSRNADPLQRIVLDRDALDPSR